MKSSWRTIPPLTARLAAGRPVLAQTQMTSLVRRVMDMTSADTVNVWVRHTAHIITRLADGQVLSSDDGDRLFIAVESQFGAHQAIHVHTNQLDDSVLRAMVHRCEALSRASLGADEDVRVKMRQVPDTLVPVHLWHDETVQAMTTTRGTVIPELLLALARAQLAGAGFLGLIAQSEAMLTKAGIGAYHEETDSELTMTARTLDGKSSGWSGAAARNWSAVSYPDIAQHAIEMARRGAGAQAVEPGRRTAILSPAAVVQIVRFLGDEFSAENTDNGLTAFSRLPRGNKLGQRVFDPRINMQSDPADPEGGYRPYLSGGEGTPAMSWVENGILKNLAYSVGYAMSRGKAYAESPYSIRISGGTTSIEQMIAQCQEGIYVNRFSGVEMVDVKTGLTTGVTRDGCFLIKHGVIDRPVKNFRFLESPFFFLNRVEALGVPVRAAFGYTPKARFEIGPSEWPRPPIIVPPMMVRDFNLASLSDVA